jgi:hypothetical protein
MSTIPRPLSPSGSSDTATHTNNTLQQDVSDALPPPQQHSELDSSAPIVFNHSMPREGPYGQLPDPPRSAVASAAVETTRQQRSSMLAQSAATSAAPTSGAPFPAIHAIETIMALESGLRIDPVFYDLIHGPHHVFTQNIGRYQQQQRLYQQNNAHDPGRPNNAYSNNQYNNPIQQHPHHDVAISAPQNTTAPRAPGPKVGQPIDARLNSVIAALRALPPVSDTEKHPVRTTLKFPFNENALTAPQQVLIRQNFHSGSGYIRSGADLMDWYGDESVFSKVFWEYLIQGQSRAVKGEERSGRREEEAEEGGGWGVIKS